MIGRPRLELGRLVAPALKDVLAALVVPDLGQPRRLES